MKSQANSQEALNRAVGHQSVTNYATIINGFIEKGIPESQILPRENVFTFNAWKALGRSVKKGEHGVKIITWIDTSKHVLKDNDKVVEKHSKRPWSAVVFHISQTEKIEEKV